MEHVKKVPWTDWDEWEKCWSFLQNDPISGLKMLQVWSVHDTLPVRIECTRLLLNCLNELTSTADPNSLLGLQGEFPRLGVSMAVTRCVNQLIDLNNDGKFARSVSNTARLLKIPDFIVDLRHDATHSALPSMFLLAKAVQELLNWLYQEYWSEQHHHLLEKSEILLKDIDKFEKRARVTQDIQILAKFADGLFKQKIECNKKKVGNLIAGLRWKMNDEAWALLFLQLQVKNKKFAESVVQGILKLLKTGEIELLQVKSTFEEILTLANSLTLSMTPWVKNLFVLQNTEQTAFDIVSLMIKANVFPSEVAATVAELHSLSLLGEKPKLKPENILEIEKLPMSRWRKLASWSPRPFGSNSLFTDFT